MEIDKQMFFFSFPSLLVTRGLALVVFFELLVKLRLRKLFSTLYFKKNIFLKEIYFNDL
jgi:hypothetical protein